MKLRTHSAFSLIEVISVIVIISFLLAMGVIKIGATRNQSVAVDNQNSLDTVQRLEQLALAECLTITNAATFGRIIELQNSLAARGHTIAKLDPTNLTAVLKYSGSTWSLLP